MISRNTKGQFVKGHSEGVRFGFGQSFGDKVKYIKISLAQKGRKLSKEHIEKLKGKRPNQSGKKNHNWKGGVSSENEKIRGSLEYKLWQDSVKNRDGNSCQRCGENRVSRIMAHHILNFSKHPKLRLAIDNGITFCRKCHKEFHMKYGFKNNTKEQMLEFIGQNL